MTGQEATFETYQESLRRWYSVLVYSHKKGYFVSPFSDITDRKRAEDGSRESEAELRQTNAQPEAILESIPEPVAISDTAGKFRSSNAAFRKVIPPEPILKNFEPYATLRTTEEL